MQHSHELEEFASATVLSTTANFIMVHEEAFTHTYRTVIRLREQGELELRFGFSNAVDSTWEHGAVAWAGRLGGSWRIEAACVADGGTEQACHFDENSRVEVTFDGSREKNVYPGEQFYSDPVKLMLPDGHDLIFSWTISAEPGASVPYNTEQMLVTAYDAPGTLADQPGASGFSTSENLLVLPAWIGYRKEAGQKLVFFGDSITQGVRTAQDGYDYWVAKIANQLGPSCGVLNLGSGWARAYDASTNTAWLEKAKQGGSRVVLCLGVNDIDIGCRTAEQLLGDLQQIITLLRSHNPSVEIVLCTVPPFNFAEEREHVWRTVNERIRSQGLEGVSRVFDIAEVLSQPVPNEHLLQPRFMSSEFDPHPNGLAGTEIADAFMRWY